MISIVCPFYNEQGILKHSVDGMVTNLSRLNEDWELIIVNDGSTDDSLKAAKSLEVIHARLRVLTYEVNQGRGYALRHGIAHASGDLIFTTEIDSSWGDDIVAKMHDALRENPTADIVVASPHLKGGGYKNVPKHRVFLSSYGNMVIRTGLSFTTTMNTGMTRGYRVSALQKLPLYENGKEFHLEVILKALSLGLRIIEVPAILEWKEYKHEKSDKKIKRKSSSKIKKLIGSHLQFSVFAAPIRYLWGLAMLALVFAVSALIYCIYRYLTGDPWANALIGSIAVSVLSLMFFSFGVLSQQHRLILTELWRIQANEEQAKESAENA